MSLGSGYDMVLPPRGDVESCPEPIPPQSVHGRRSGHHAGGARRGRQISRISDPTTEARVRLALPPHIPHQIARSSSSTRARGRARGASGSASRTNRGSSRPPVPPRPKGKARLPPVPCKVSTKASRQSTLGYTHGSSLSVDGAQTTNSMVTQDTDKLFIQVRPPCGRNTYVLRLIVLD